MGDIDRRIEKIEKTIGELECTCRDQGVVVVLATVTHQGPDGGPIPLQSYPGDIPAHPETDRDVHAIESCHGIECPTHGRQLLRLVVISPIDAKL